MSRVGLKPVTLPEGVSLTVNGQVVTVKGPKGELNVKIHEGVSVQVENGILTSSVADNVADGGAHHGTAMANLRNAVIGVSNLWKKDLEINGIGYRAAMRGNDIVLSLGYSHEVVVSPIGSTKITLKDETHITVEGIDKQEVGQTAALIHDVRRPEPYGGKGVKYADEVIIRKIGKRATGGKK